MSYQLIHNFMILLNVTRFIELPHFQKLHLVYICSVYFYSNNFDKNDCKLIKDTNLQKKEASNFCSSTDLINFEVLAFQAGNF